MCLNRNVLVDGGITATNSTKPDSVWAALGGLRCRCNSSCHMDNILVQNTFVLLALDVEVFCILLCLVSKFEWPLSYFTTKPCDDIVRMQGADPYQEGACCIMYY
ncbi:hypothetical protein VPH35_038186 [Triticum aestivum]|uniref:Uncharacterized protein n=1 Tax=Aegilops tauschii subsp. strangulata TaxID=200361 RepID=A0A453C7R1_AEGTS